MPLACLCFFSLFAAVSVFAAPFKMIGLVSAWDPEMKALNFGNIFPDDVWVVRKGESIPRQVHAFAMDTDLLDAARIAAPKASIRRADGSKANVVIGGIGVSGPIFLDDRSFRDFAFQKWHARIHEMEGTAKILERIESAQ